MANKRYESFDPEAADLGADPQKAGAIFTTLGWLLAVLWLGGAGLGMVSLLGLEALREAGPIAAAALALMTIVPAFLIVFAAAAAREGARGRAEAGRLAAAADRLHNPSPAAEAAARKLGVSVRGEIAALDRALDHVGQKLREVEAVIARQTLAVDNAAAAAEAGARHMVSGLERERNDLLQIADDLHNQARLIGEAISRHTKMIGDAARLAEAEVRAADEALDSRLSSFGAAAALISDRTQALNGAAKESAEAALRLEGALSGSLDALAKATSLTDAARQSAEAATLAANSTAGAIRETTQRAVEEARRAAELIRAEAAALSGGAATGAASARSEAAPTRRQQAFIGGGKRPEAEAPSAPSEAQHSPRPGDPGFADSLSAPAQGRGGASQPPPDKWTWRDVLASVDDEDSEPPTAARGRDADPRRPAPPQDKQRMTGNVLGQRAPERAAERASERVPERAPDRGGDRAPAPAPEYRRPSGGAPSAAPGGAVIEAAGLRLQEVFGLSALERIAQKARGGTQARRRAVREAAPDAVLRLANHLDADARARSEAAAFLRSDGARIAELLGRGRASMSADATRAFLLIDAAAS